MSIRNTAKSFSFASAGERENDKKTTKPMILCTPTCKPYTGRKKKSKDKNQDSSGARYDDGETDEEIEITDSTENGGFSCFRLTSKLCSALKIKLTPYEVNTCRYYFSPLLLES